MQATLKILIVDDNPTILKLVADSLEKCGEIVTATDGADALVQAIEKRPDLIIADYSMPVMNGLALLEKLRARKETGEIPFVFLACQKDIDDRLRTVVEGVEDYFVKPFLVRDLAKQARRITARLLQQRMENVNSRGGSMGGHLSEMSLIDWMQSLDQGRKTCALELRLKQDACTLFFNEGAVTHATYGDLKGDAAVFKALTWAEGEWELDFNKTTPERSTTMSTQALMMEGLRLLDESNRDAEN